nr:MaoC/PaaZ C-terminal domain-containing protein [Gordonia rhizosphera]
MHVEPTVVFAEDLRVGHEYQLGAHTVTEAELLDFARQWDPQGFHVDAEIAAAGAFGGLIASGIHTIAVFQRLAVRDVFDAWSVIAGRRLVEVAFLHPVRPDDTLTGSMVIDDIVFDDRARALVTGTAIMVNQKNRPVLRTVVELFVRSRS